MTNMTVTRLDAGKAYRAPAWGSIFYITHIDEEGWYKSIEYVHGRKYDREYTREGLDNSIKEYADYIEVPVEEFYLEVMKR